MKSWWRVFQEMIEGLKVGKKLACWKNQTKLYRAKEQWMKVRVLSNDIREVNKHKPRPSK